MRKLLMALFAMFVMAGLVIAGEGIVTKVDAEKKKVTIKVGDAEKEYDATDAKLSRTDKDGKATDSDLATLAKSAARKDKDGKVVGAKVEFEAEGTKLKTVTWKGGGKKN